MLIGDKTTGTVWGTSHNYSVWTALKLIIFTFVGASFADAYADMINKICMHILILFGDKIYMQY